MVHSVPLFDGGDWNGPAVGMCGGVLSATLPLVAAATFSIITSGLSSLLRIPLKGIGVGGGTGPPGDGTIRMCVPR
jgi:hypothetical protein